MRARKVEERRTHGGALRRESSAVREEEERTLALPGGELGEGKPFLRVRRA